MQAEIRIDRPGRYLEQFCKHASKMGSGGHMPRMHGATTPTVTADWSDTEGTVTFDPWGSCALAAGDGVLTLTVEGPGAARIRDIVTRDIERFTRRNPVTISWQPGADDQPATPKSRRLKVTALIAVAVVVMVGVHAGLIGVAIGHPRWALLVAGVFVVAMAVKGALLYRSLRHQGPA